VPAFRFDFISLEEQLRMPTEAPNIFLTIDVERGSDESVVHCSGTLVSGACSYLHKEVYPLIADSKRILLDLTDVQWVDSMGLGALVRLHVVAKKNGCQLQLANINQRVKDLLTITNLLGVFGEIREKGN
jgi:anti-anti-sigma factor